MKEFVMLYRNNYEALPKVTPEQAQATTQKWMDWIAGLDSQGKLVARGNRLEPSTGKVIRPGSVVTNGPYAEIKESIGGFSIIRAGSFDEAVELAKGCPILNFGGNVEVREVSQL